jgi:BirA family biotin operon repressor/biotin-[acetyl-CoA-carboxylase] ligase
MPSSQSGSSLTTDDYSVAAAQIEPLLPLIELLSDGQTHSGESLGARLGVTRTAVWKQLKKLEPLGLDLISNRGSGYRLQTPISPLDYRALEDQVLAAAKGDVAFVGRSCVDSTNTRLVRYLESPDAKPLAVCCADIQIAGRGRRGRAWQSPFGRNIYLSLGGQFETSVTDFEGLSLAVGVILVEVLTLMGLSDLGLKWPNDVYWQRRKLAGVLVEITGDLSGQYSLVVGVGMNYAMPEALGRSIDQPWVDLAEICAHANIEPPSRQKLMSLLAQRLLALLTDYPKQGFEPYWQAWRQDDIYAGQHVSLTFGSRTVVGVGRGVNKTGALLLEVDGREQAFSGGEISLRRAP